MARRVRCTLVSFALCLLLAACAMQPRRDEGRCKLSEQPRGYCAYTDKPERV